MEPRILKINPKNLGEAKAGLVSSTIFYLVVAILLRLTIMRPTISKDEIQLVKREFEMMNRPASVGSDDGSNPDSRKYLDFSNGEHQLKH